jgi:hypothetical protein
VPQRLSQQALSKVRFLLHSDACPLQLTNKQTPVASRSPQVHPLFHGCDIYPARANTVRSGLILQRREAVAQMGRTSHLLFLRSVH